MLSKDMTTTGEYIQTFKLKFSTTKKVSIIFHSTTRKLYESKKTIAAMNPCSSTPSPNTAE